MELNYKSYGEGEPVIILHGLLGSLDNWHSIARKLAANYRVFLLDQRNHGKSPHADKMDYPSMAEDVFAFMQAQNIPSAYFAGHSMGGKTAMTLALKYPESVDKLVSIDMPPKQNSPGHETIFQALNAMDLSKVEKRRDADEQLKQYIPDFGIRQFLLKNLERGPKGGYQWKMNLKAIENAYPNILEGVTAEKPCEKPTLFIRGEKSDYIKSSELGDYQKLFPRARLETIEEAGHWVHAEAPEAFIQSIIQFFSDQ